MTLDGHLKTGLAMSLAWTATANGIYPGIESSMIHLVAIFIFLGNIAPDFIEFKVIPHRTYTHFFWFYLILATVGYIGTHELGTLNMQAGFLEVSVGLAMIGFSMGSISHILCDWPYYGGIPLLNPKKKVKLLGIEFDQVSNRIIEHTVLLMWLSFILLPLIPESAISTESIFSAFEGVDSLFSESKDTIEQ
jgi:hypothetical protein